MSKITEKDINNFFIKYYSSYYKEDNLIYDNIKVLKEIMLFTYQHLGNYIENNKEETDWNKIKKSTFIEYAPIIDKFYKELNININLNELIENGTIDLYTRSLEELIEVKGKCLNGFNDYEGKYKTVYIYNNGLITDSITLVHELSHYRNQPDIKRNQVNNLFTEALAFTEELIYLDYIDNLGYTYESNIFKHRIIETFYYIIVDTYPLVKLHLLYNEIGKISKEDYELLFKMNDYDNIINTFKEIIKDTKTNINNFDKDILNNKEIMDKLNDNFISDIMYILAAPLSIYMYEEYKKDNNFINNIKLLNDTLMNNNTNDKTVVECLNIIGLSNYKDESLNKIKEAYKSYIKKLENTEKEIKTK